MYPCVGVQFPDASLGMVVTEVGKGTGAVEGEVRPGMEAGDSWGQGEGTRQEGAQGCSAQSPSRRIPVCARAAELARHLRASRTASCPPAKLAEDPQSRWHGTTVVASLPPSSRESTQTSHPRGQQRAPRLLKPQPTCHPWWRARAQLLRPLRRAPASEGQASLQEPGPEWAAA